MQPALRAAAARRKQFNDFGQVTKVIDPEGNVTTMTYFPEDDPDGDGVDTPTPADGRTLDTVDGGYLDEMVRDATRSYYDQGGSSSSGAFSNNNEDPTEVAITTSYTYDDVGNRITATDGRGIRDGYFVTEHDRVVRVKRAADISGASSASPSDPLVGASIGALTAFAYESRSFFDYNGNLVLSQTEDRKNTSSVDGSGLGTLPSQATNTTPGLSSADSAGGSAYVDTLHLYDRIDHRVETRREVDSSTSLDTLFRYDDNGNLVLTIHPEGNADATKYDERDLPFQRFRGYDGTPATELGANLAAGDPSSFDRPGGSSTTESVVTYSYDKNRNLVEIIDAADTDSDTNNNAATGGVTGDVTTITYDGYDRPRIPDRHRNLNSRRHRFHELRRGESRTGIAANPGQASQSEQPKASLP